MPWMPKVLDLSAASAYKFHVLRRLFPPTIERPRKHDFVLSPQNDQNLIPRALYSGLLNRYLPKRYFCIIIRYLLISSIHVKVFQFVNLVSNTTNISWMICGRQWDMIVGHGGALVESIAFN